jgi:predicted O-linked N-acetylglucosamine transferase (SPINDLY family)
MSDMADNQVRGDAVVRFQTALRLTPNDPKAYYRLARALAHRHRVAEAVLCYRQALRIDPEFADAHEELGDTLRRHRSTTLDEPVSCYREAIRLKPDNAAAHHKLGRTLSNMGLVDDAITAYRRACQLHPNSAEFHSRLLCCLHLHTDYDSAALGQEHDRWNERHAKALAPVIEWYSNDRDPNRRIRIGYVSAHLNNHPVGRFLLPLVKAHDRDNFEIYCYAGARAADELTAIFRDQSDRWYDVVDMTDESLADLIRRHRIDILVDLDAHMGGNRLLTFARKPAPVQVTYLAYCSTTGLSAMDYRLTDPFLDPPGRPTHYAEESVCLPESYWCYQPSTERPPVARLPALVNGQVTFGCLNSYFKVTLPTLTVWRELLLAVPGSRLLLHADPGTHRDRAAKFFAEKDVDLSRIVFVDFCPPAQYFELYHRIDIGLDPFPYAGGTTTCDALWMGVPVVSLAGRTAVGRGGLSILSNVGLSELVVQTPEEYVRIASNLAADLPRLTALRVGLRDRMLRSPLADAPRFARHVEGAFREIWQRWCRETIGSIKGKSRC